jgi:hypothetical protein
LHELVDARFGCRLCECYRPFILARPMQHNHI